MAAHLRCDDVLLLLEDQRIAVEVDLGLFLPDTGLWGGVLRRVPRWVAHAMRDAGARLRFPSGWERRIRPLVIPDDETSVLFIGEGKAPF
ncbi:hypothetical protein ACFW6K_22385 [Streptomyces sp. NPDC058733]|uniref:hypothetical protein n=1 Tax=unclassified Streptomyces TaxID=2593676 RepID=UPI0034522CE5